MQGVGGSTPSSVAGFGGSLDLLNHDPDPDPWSWVLCACTSVYAWP
jgi:hypothetical protein